MREDFGIALFVPLFSIYCVPRMIWEGFTKNVVNFPLVKLVHRSMGG